MKLIGTILYLLAQASIIQMKYDTYYINKNYKNSVMIKYKQLLTQYTQI